MIPVTSLKVAMEAKRKASPQPELRERKKLCMRRRKTEIDESKSTNDGKGRRRANREKSKKDQAKWRKMDEDANCLSTDQTALSTGCVVSTKTSQPPRKNISQQCDSQGRLTDNFYIWDDPPQIVSPPSSDEYMISPDPRRGVGTKKIALSRVALKGLQTMRLVATIQELNADFVMYNDRMDYVKYGIAMHRRNNMQELLDYSPTISKALSKMPYQEVIRMECRTLQFISFAFHPRLWVDRVRDSIGLEMNRINEEERCDYLDGKKGSTRTIERDTSCPDITREDVACIIIGDPHVVASTLDASLSYADACNRTYRTIFSLKEGDKPDEVGMNLKRSNDFPVLVALDTERHVVMDGTVYKTDFFERTGEGGRQHLMPLLITSPTEVVHRIQAYYIEHLYAMGAVQLDPTPVDSSGVFFKLHDSDKVSQQMNLVRSDTIMYQVSIACVGCGQSHNEYWLPNDEKHLSRIVSEMECSLCKQRTIANNSCFVLRESTCRVSMDPGCSRLIRYEIPRVDVKPPEKKSGENPGRQRCCCFLPASRDERTCKGTSAYRPSRAHIT